MLVVERAGVVRNVTFEDLTIDGAEDVTVITMHYSSNDPAPPVDERTPHVEDITFRRITATRALNAGTFACLPESSCRGLLLEDVSVDSVGGFQCIRAEGQAAGAVAPASCL